MANKTYISPARRDALKQLAGSLSTYILVYVGAGGNTYKLPPQLQWCVEKGYAKRGELTPSGPWVCVLATPQGLKLAAELAEKSANAQKITRSGTK